MPTFTLVGTATGANGTGSLTPTMPTYAAGDLSLFFAFARTNTETITTPPSGYVLFKAGITGAGGEGNLAVYGKICTGSESAPTVGFSSTGRHSAVISVLRSSTGWPTLSVASDLVVITSEESNTIATMRANAITPTENDTCVVALCGKGTTTADITDVATPSGYTDLAEIITNSAAGIVLSAWFLGQTTAAAIADANATLTGGSNTTTTAQITIALRAAATATLAVKLLVDASAASAASVEGVVLNSTRDTVIGEFSGQTFEAALEGGEAVLLIPVADILPDGSTLTTSDTPIVFAYNATLSTVGPGSATVIEV